MKFYFWEFQVANILIWGVLTPHGTFAIEGCLQNAETAAVEVEILRLQEHFYQDAAVIPGKMLAAQAQWAAARRSW